ncbi:MAG: 2OG-Fe(II) oxygenase family protein [Pseudomonadota bacterium]
MTIATIALDRADPTSLETALTDIGFVQVIDHEISPALINAVRRSLIEYFALSDAAKMADQITRDNYRGFIPLGFFSPNQGGGGADRYEGYKLHAEVAVDDPIRTECDLYGPNRWPESTPDVRRFVSAYWRECDRVSTVLLGIIAEILDVNVETFLAKFSSPLTNMTLLHYPPQSADEAGVGIHAHKDTDVLTMLINDPAGGLFVKARTSDDWIEVAGPPDALIVNVGDMLELFSGGRLVSTPHKVVNSTGAERYSFPYFVVPRHDVVVAALVEPLDGFDRSPVHVGDVSREVWRTNWPDTESSRPEFDLGTLANA